MLFYLFLAFWVGVAAFMVYRAVVRVRAERAYAEMRRLFGQEWR